MQIKYLIIGSGIGGLSSAAFLRQAGELDFLIIDKVKEFPYNLNNGLHYLHNIPNLPFEVLYKTIPLTEEIWNTKTNTFKKQANIFEMFEYSKKVMENLRHKSSITDPGLRTEVYVPISNNMNDLLDIFYVYIGADKFFPVFFKM